MYGRLALLAVVCWCVQATAFSSLAVGHIRLEDIFEAFFQIPIETARPPFSSTSSTTHQPSPATTTPGMLPAGSAPSSVPPAAATSQTVSNLSTTFAGQLTEDSRRRIEAWAKQFLEVGLSLSGSRSVQSKVTINDPLCILIATPDKVTLVDLKIPITCQWTELVRGQTQSRRGEMTWDFHFDEAVRPPESDVHTTATWTVDKLVLQHDAQPADRRTHVSATWSAKRLDANRYHVVVVADPHEQEHLQWLREIRPRWILTRRDSSTESTDRDSVPTAQANSSPDPTPPPTVTPDLLGQANSTGPTEPLPTNTNAPPGQDFFDLAETAPSSAAQPTPTLTTPPPSPPVTPPPEPIQVDQPPTTQTFFELPDDQPVEHDVDLLGQEPHRKQGN